MMRDIPVRANGCEEHPATLAAMHDCYRPLIVFAPSDSDERLRMQMIEFRHHSSELRERDVMVMVVVKDSTSDSAEGTLPMARLTDDEAAKIRKRFEVSENDFAILLIGKDGGEKFRQTDVLTVATLNKKIDAMPMRKDEMGRR